MSSPLRVVLLFASLTATFAVGPAAAWDQFHTGVMRETPECVSWGQGRIDCFARRADGHLSWTYFARGNWSTPKDLGGALAAAPACVVRGPSGINCFATSAKGVLATIALNGSTWGDWGSLGGALIPSRVACLALGRDRIACFARGRKGQLMMRRWSGGKSWEAWRDLGGSLSADPECLPVSDASAACFGRSEAGELIAYLPDTTGKTGGWTSLGGRIEGRPSCVRLRSGETACIAQGRSGRLQMWRGMALHASGAGITASTDDVVGGEPACALQSGTLVCLLRDAQGRLVRRSLGSGVDTTRDGILASPAAAAVTCLAVGPDGIGCVLADTSGKLHFASNHSLEVGTAVDPRSAADEQAQGAWYLSNMSTGATCRIDLSPDLAFGAKRLRLGPRCRALGLASFPAQWDQDENELLFLGAEGQIVLRFHSTQTGRWISPRRAVEFLLTREPPEAAGETMAPQTAPRIERAGGVGGTPDMFSEMLGPWRVYAQGQHFICTLYLTTAPEGEGYRVRPDRGCREFLPPARYWRDSGPALVLFDGYDEAVARFEAIDDGYWHTEALGGLTLSR